MPRPGDTREKGEGSPPLRVRGQIEGAFRGAKIGPFTLVRPLGSGGYAPVWLAREIYGEIEVRTAAIKLFQLGGEDAPAGLRARIIEEARAICSVEHPNIVRYYTLCIDEERGLAGLVMEHLDGTSLDRRLLNDDPLSLRETLDVGTAVASALSAIHRVGLVHRDVKPGNIVASLGVYKLIDFGIAMHRSPQREATSLPSGVRRAKAPSQSGGQEVEACETLTHGFNETGTLGYMDPACSAEGRASTAASDLYALGATLFACITGVLPAIAAGGLESKEGKAVLRGERPAPPLKVILPPAPDRLAALVDALLHPEPTKRPRSAEWVAIELDRVRAELSGRSRAMPPEGIGPFRGLGRFEQGDRDVYFGRGIEIAAALEMIRERGVCALVGATGSGKSSLARAGVLPAVADGRLGGWPSAWDAIVTTPGDSPRESVATALAPVVAGAGAFAPQALVALLTERAESADRGVILLIDQLEELASANAEESRDWLVELIAEAGRTARPGVRILLTARSDLLDRLLVLGDLGKPLGRSLSVVSPMSGAVWAEVARQALGAYGYRFEDEALEQEVSHELEAMGGAMPLAQFALTELWRARDAEHKIITRSAFASLGGLSGVLSRHADAVLSRLTRTLPEGESTSRAVFLALTTPKGTRIMRSRQELEAMIGPSCPAVLDALVKERLLVSEVSGVTLAHESLVMQWDRLGAWVAESRDDLRLASELERDAARFASDADDTSLWKKRRLLSGLDLLRAPRVTVSAQAKAFLEASRRAERRAKRGIAAAVGCVFVALLAALLMALSQRSAAEDARREAEKRARESDEHRLAEQDLRVDKERLLAEKQRLLDRIEGLATHADPSSPETASGELAAIKELLNAPVVPVALPAPASAGKRRPPPEKAAAPSALVEEAPSAEPPAPKAPEDVPEDVLFPPPQHEED